MRKHNRAELVTLQGRRLWQVHVPRHHCPAAISGARSPLVLAVSLATLSSVVGCGKTQAALAIPSREVEVASAGQKDVSIYSEWVATLDGYVNVQIQPQVTGYIIRQTYKEGSFVRKGQILFHIDSRPFQAELDQVNAQLAQSRQSINEE